MFRRIVCATDFSTPAAVAMRYAASIARVFDAKLELVHAWNWIDELSGEYAVLRPEAVNESRQRDEARLAKLGAELRAAGVDVTTKLVDGAPDRAIVAYAAESKADLVVTGTEGRTGVARALLGSVAERILRTSDVPVLAVPKSTTVAIDARFAPKQILVPVDLGASSAEILRKAVGLAKKAGGKVTALHAWTALTVPGEGRAAKEAEERATENVNAWIAEVLGEDRPGVDVMVRHRVAADAIVDACTECKTDLLMMATAGRTGLQHFMLGSVTELALRSTQRPVLTFRRPAAE